MTDLQFVQDEPLVRAKVDQAAVGNNWPKAIVQLIEWHEKIHLRLLKRKEVHVLIDRYVAAYFPDVTIEHEHRRFVLRLLRERWYFRWTVYMDGMRRALAAETVAARVVLK